MYCTLHNCTLCFLCVTLSGARENVREAAPLRTRLLTLLHTHAWHSLSTDLIPMAVCRPNRTITLLIATFSIVQVLEFYYFFNEPRFWLSSSALTDNSPAERVTCTADAAGHPIIHRADASTLSRICFIVPTRWDSSSRDTNARTPCIPGT